MNIKESISKLWNRGRVAPPDPRASTWVSYSGFRVPASMALSPEQSMTLSAVFSCVRVIVESLATSPWTIYTKDVGGNRVPVIDSTVDYVLNVRANSESTAQLFKEALLLNTIVYGDGYAEIVRDTAGRFTELQLIPSQYVSVMRARGGEPISTSPARNADTGELIYSVSPQSSLGASVVYLEAKQVLHVRSLASVTGLLGQSVVAQAARTAALAMAAETYALDYFANNATVGTVFTLPPGQTLKADKQEEAEKKFQSERAGAGRGYKTLFIPNGATVTPLGHNAEEAQLDKSRELSVQDISRYFGVPLHLINVSVASAGYGRNLNEMGIMFVRHTLSPWKQRLVQEVNFKLFTQRTPWTYADLDLTWLSHGDAQSRAQAYAIMRRNGVISANEWRQFEGMNSVGPEGDLLVIDGTVTLMDEEELGKPDPAVAPGDQQSQESDPEDEGGTNQEPPPEPTEGD